MTAGPYSIGSDTWPGLAKVTEECAEVIQVTQKIMAAGGGVQHWYGTNLRRRLEEEIADVLAAAEFLTSENRLDRQAIADRYAEKIFRFNRWRAEHCDGSNG